jgi:hypothetical protein
VGCSWPDRRTAAVRRESTPIETFRWPDGKRAAISLTFDDARRSQPDVGFTILGKYNVKATFYVLERPVRDRLEQWKQAVRYGHEIGCHSCTHPCSFNFKGDSNKALENWTLDMIAADIDRANGEIEELLGIKPVTFAYPCSQKFVGRGKNTKSYVPVVAEKFLAGRGGLDEFTNAPEGCDLAQLMGTELDGLSPEEAIAIIEEVAKRSRWVIFYGHEIAPVANRQTTTVETLEAVCEYANDPENGIWIDTVEEIGTYILAQRGN